jgi:hypothetical protein
VKGWRTYSLSAVGMMACVLPRELCDEILSWVSDASVPKLRLVCCAWNDILRYRMLKCDMKALALERKSIQEIQYADHYSYGGYSSNSSYGYGYGYGSQ